MCRRARLFKLCLLGYTAVDTFPVFPLVLNLPVTNIPLGVIKLRDGKFAVRIFGTVHTAPGEQACQLRDSDGVKLFMKDVVDALLQVGNLRLKVAYNQALGDLTQKYSCLTGRVEMLHQGCETILAAAYQASDSQRPAA